MTVIFRNTDSIGTGKALTLAAGDQLFVTEGVDIASTDDTGVYAPGAVRVENHGTIFGFQYGVLVGSSGQTTVINGVDGIISGGGNSGAALQVEGTHLITNYGEIDSLGGGFGAIFTTGAGAIYNYGSIAGGILNADTAFGDPIAITYNYGTLTGGYGSTSSSIEELVNAGTLTGHVGLGIGLGSGSSVVNTGVINGDIQAGGNGDRVVNAGVINGKIEFINGTGMVVDSSLGQIFGPIVCSDGGTTVIGATNGGSILGGSGNDVEVANQGQAAADAAVRATLDGAGGTNALYGGGAFNLFVAGDTHGGYDQIWGGASKMGGVPGDANNTLSFATAPGGVFVDLLNGHDAYIGATGGNWSGTGTYEDSIVNVPNVVGSAFGDVIQADDGIDRITGGGHADSLYAGAGAGSHDTFAYTGYSDSNTVTGYDTIVDFKIGADKVDLSALHTDGSHLAMFTSGISNTVYVEQTPGTFNAATDLALIVNTSTTGGLHASDFVF